MIQIRPPQRPRKGGTLRPLGFFRSGPARQQSWLVTWADAKWTTHGWNSRNQPLTGFPVWTYSIIHSPNLNQGFPWKIHPLSKLSPAKKKNLLAVCACFQVAMPVALAGKGTNSCCQGRSNQRTDSRPEKCSVKFWTRMFTEWPYLLTRCVLEMEDCTVLGSPV